MTIIGSTNLELPTSGTTLWANAIFAMKEYLTGLAEPWVVLASSDGVTYSPDSDVIDDAAEMLTEGAWFVITPPNAGYQLCFEKGSFGRGRMSMSLFGLFADGGGHKAAASASVPWSAPDEHFLFGTASAFDQYSISGSPVAGDIRAHVVTSDVAIEGHYPLYIMFTNVASSSSLMAFCYGVDVMLEATRHPSHPKNLVGLETDERARACFYEDVTSGASAVRFTADLEGRVVDKADLYNSRGHAYSDLDAPGSDEIMYPFYWFVSGPVSVGGAWAGDVNMALGMSALMRTPGTKVAHDYPDRSNPGTASERVWSNSGSASLIPWPQGVTPL